MYVTPRRVVAAGVTVLLLGTGGVAMASTAANPIAHNSGTGNFTGVVLNGGLEVVADCTAAATGLAVSENITECFLTTGGGNHPLALPGPAATSAFVAKVPLEPVQLCWRAVATYSDGNTKPTQGCTSDASTSSGQVGAGASLD